MDEPQERESDAKNRPEEVLEEKRASLSLGEVRDQASILHRMVVHAVREEGLHLWKEKYLDAQALRVLDRLQQGWADCPTEAVERLDALRLLFGGLSGLPWFEQVAPLENARLHAEALLKEVPDERLEFRPVAEVVLRDQNAGPNKKKEREERGGRRGRRRGRGRQRTQEESEVQGPAAPRKVQAHDLGDEAHTGKALDSLEGFNEQWVSALKERGINTVSDLLMLIPTTHENIKCVDKVDEIKSGKTMAITGRVRATWLRLTPKQRTSEALVEVDDAVILASWAEASPSRSLRGQRVALHGPVRKSKGAIHMKEPRIWRADSRGTIRRPIYGIEGVDDSELNDFIRVQLDRYLPGLRDTLPDNVLRTGNVLGLRDAIREIHIPTGGVRYGRNRFVFEEFFRHQLQLAAKKRSHRRGIAHPVQHDRIAQLQIQHGIVLNDGQEKAFDEIRRDLARPLAMNRLLQGDVSSGKAVVALLSAVVVASSRGQVLFVAPNALAAEHRYLFAEPLLRSVGAVPSLVTGTPTAGQRDAIKRGQASVIFATPEFYEESLPEFKRLGLVVVEERSSFGTVTGETFAQGKNHADFLVVTSVPVPPSLAFTVFSDVDITVIEDSAGPGDCSVAQPDERDQVYKAIRGMLEEGKQAYIVFPMRDGEDVIDRSRGDVLASAMAQEAFPGHNVALFHGSMNRDERFKVFDDFLHRKIDVLIATTAIEDAPEVDNAAGIMVENADHFDLVRLYRLRGHVSSDAEGPSCFFVLSKKPAEEAVQVVELVAKETDAFSLAEKDREARGDGALLGGRIEDLPQFKWADIGRDRDVLIRARRTVFSILAEDPTLQRRIYRGLVEGPTKAAETRKAGREEPDGGRRRRRRRPRKRRGGSGGESSAKT